MKKFILRTFATTWLILSVITLFQAVGDHLFLLSVFMIVQWIIAYQFCERTWQNDCADLGK